MLAAGLGYYQKTAFAGVFLLFNESPWKNVVLDAIVYYKQTFRQIPESILSNLLHSSIILLIWSELEQPSKTNETLFKRNNCFLYTT